MANEKTKVKTGKRLEWTLMMTDEKGFLLGIHFDRHRKYSKAQMDILKAALCDAAEKLDDLPVTNGHKSDELRCEPLSQYVADLQGQWVALVPAENDRHLKMQTATPNAAVSRPRAEASETPPPAPRSA